LSLKLGGSRYNTSMTYTIREAVERMGTGPLTEAGLVEHIHPLFSRALRRDELYLANHSLGRPLDRTAADITQAVDRWYDQMDHAWEGWMASLTQFRSLWASLIGSERADAVVPKSAAGQGLRAVLNAMETTCPRVVTTTGEFDSIDFILKSYQRKGRAHIHAVPPEANGLFDADRIIQAIDDSTDLVVVSLVVFASGQMLEGVDRIIQAAHRHGAWALVDTYHAAGAVPTQVHALDADFAIGGSYKYVRGGPGASWLWIHPRHLSTDSLPDTFTLDTGWFAKAGTMDFARDEQPRLNRGGDAWLESTPAVLPFVQALAGLELIEAIGIERLWKYNQQQQQILADALDDRGVPMRLLEPRGAFLTVLSDDPKTDVARLRAQGLVTDGRRDASGRGIVRYCPDLLNTRAELLKAAEITQAVFANRT
jgi:kynureninase